jgi:hypothetical protein
VTDAGRLIMGVGGKVAGTGDQRIHCGITVAVILNRDLSWSTPSTTFPQFRRHVPTTANTTNPRADHSRPTGQLIRPTTGLW